LHVKDTKRVQISVPRSLPEIDLDGSEALLDLNGRSIDWSTVFEVQKNLKKEYTDDGEVTLQNRLQNGKKHTCKSPGKQTVMLVTVDPKLSHHRVNCDKASSILLQNVLFKIPEFLKRSDADIVKNDSCEFRLEVVEMNLTEPRRSSRSTAGKRLCSPLFSYDDDLKPSLKRQAAKKQELMDSTKRKDGMDSFKTEVINDLINKEDRTDLIKSGEAKPVSENTAERVILKSKGGKCLEESHEEFLKSRHFSVDRKKCDGALKNTLPNSEYESMFVDIFKFDGSSTVIENGESNRELNGDFPKNSVDMSSENNVDGNGYTVMDAVDELSSTEECDDDDDDDDDHDDVDAVHTCSYCFKVFHKRLHLSRHIRIHTHKYDHNSRNVSSDGSDLLTDHERTKDDIQGSVDDPQFSVHECKLCWSSFTKARYLTRHMAVHTGAFRCNVCMRTFARKATLIHHVVVEHCEAVDRGEVEAFHCPKCVRVFSLKKSLIEHVKLHAKMADHVDCAACEKSFASKYSLRNHICSADVLASDLAIEMDDGCFKCRECNKVVNQRLAMLKHLKVHTDKLVCGTCGKRYTRRDELVTHQVMCLAAVVTGRNGSVSCETCDAMFTDVNQFAAHRREHTHPHQVGVKLYLENWDTVVWYCVQFCALLM